MADCPRCNGCGQVPGPPFRSDRERQDWAGTVTGFSSALCPNCGGTGRVAEQENE